MTLSQLVNRWQLLWLVLLLVSSLFNSRTLAPNQADFVISFLLFHFPEPRHPSWLLLSFHFFHLSEPRHPSWLLESSDPVEEKRTPSHPVDPLQRFFEDSSFDFLFVGYPLQSSLFNINYQIMHGLHVCRSPVKFLGDHESLPYLQNHRCCIQHQLSNHAWFSSLVDKQF